MRWLQRAERALLLAGVCMLAWYATSVTATRLAATRAISEFEQQRSLAVAPPDTSSWSAARVEAYEASDMDSDSMLGVLDIARVGVQAPIYRGTSEDSLNRGLGWVVGTGIPGEDGNVAVAGHRDGFFRDLKDILEGDRVVLYTLAGETVYEVSSTEIVTPADVHVLAPTDAAKLTLITCYPFYFVGSAPYRFIVHARVVEAQEPFTGSSLE